MGYEEFNRRIPLPKIPVGLTVVVVLLVVILVGALFLSVGRVNVGYVAVIVDPVRGTVSSAGDGATARYFFKAPWASVVQVYVATASVHMWTEDGQTGDWPAVPCLTKDGLGVKVDITVRWTLSPSLVQDLYRKFPALDWEERVIIPVVRETLRDIIAQFTAIETIEKRQPIAVQLESQLRSALEAEPSLANATVLGTIDLREIALPGTFVAAIEAKLAAEQLAIAAEFNATKILVLANATKWSGIIEAEGVAIEQLTIANATYEAIQIIGGGTVTPELTNLYLYMRTLSEIAQTGNAMIIIVGGNQTVPFILPTG